MTILFVSPHLDDAALSCAWRLGAFKRSGHRVVVVTLFTEAGGTSANRKYRRRRDEDRGALQGIGVEVVHAGLLDAPWRLGCGFDSRFLFGSKSGRCPEDVARVRQRVSELACQLSPQEIWWPLAVGGHVDHRITHEAADRNDSRARFYEDRPYAFDSEALAERVSASGMNCQVDHYSDDRESAALHLISEYRSQVPVLFPDLGLAETYRRFARDGQGYFERRYAPATSNSGENQKNTVETAEI